MYTAQSARKVWNEKLEAIPEEKREEALKTVLEYLCFEDPHFVAWKKIDTQMPEEVAALAKASDHSLYTSFSQGNHAEPESALAKKNSQAWQAAHNMVAGVKDEDLRAAFVSAMRAMICNPFLSGKDKCDHITAEIEKMPILGDLIAMKGEFQINCDVTASEMAEMMAMEPVNAGGAPSEDCKLDLEVDEADAVEPVVVDLATDGTATGGTEEGEQEGSEEGDKDKGGA
jgi:hypothetical protein